MPPLVMNRRASDNVYLHKDFHGALSAGIEYLHTRFGEQAVRDYLCHFARVFYAPLREALVARGLVALKEHLECSYAAEGGDVQITMDDHALTLRVKACPALAHMRSRGLPVAALFGETTRSLYPALCAGTPYAARIIAYDDRTGAAEVRFEKVCP